jgi:hypothetical protein
MKPRLAAPILLTLGLLFVSAGLGLGGSAVARDGLDTFAIDRTGASNDSAGGGTNSGGGGGNDDDDDDVVVVEDDVVVVEEDGSGGDGDGSSDGGTVDDGFTDDTGSGVDDGSGSGDGVPLARTGLVALPLLAGGLLMLGTGTFVRRRAKR